jgi:uncharacterized protein (DUF1800 family)
MGDLLEGVVCVQYTVSLSQAPRFAQIGAEKLAREVPVRHAHPLVRNVAIASLCALPFVSPGAQHRTAVVTPVPKRELSQAEQVTHVLSRLTFGARPGDAAKVTAMGVDKWIERQLRPGSITDSDVDFALSEVSREQLRRAIPAMTSGTASEPSPSLEDRVMGVRTVTPRSSRGMVAAAMRLPPPPDPRPTSEVALWKILRAQLTERQLLEVVTDFWENHFSVYVAKMPSNETILKWEREVIRPHAFGKFRDLLGSVARSPAMMFYLDNWLSRRDSINENYARELLELHTLGVDGGYTQKDVIEVARAFTGWTLTDPPPTRSLGFPVTFRFKASLHDTAAKTVLGHPLPAGRGIEDGEAVLDIVARHPSTARFIAFKLARRFVSDVPPAALVDRAAATFTATDGDITAVLRTIIYSEEFFSRAAFRAKVKTPFEFLISAVRALEISTESGAPSVRFLREFGQPVYGRMTPEGWPEYGEAWANSTAILKRVFFSADLLEGRVQYMQVGRWEGWGLATRDATRQADGVIRLLLGGVAAPNTRAAILSAAGDGEARLREMATIALGSPDYQRR